MARREITHYAVFHTIGGATDITMYYQGGGSDTVNNIPFTEAGFVIDLLRNEKPLAYDHAKTRLSTSAREPVGDAE